MDHPAMPAALSRGRVVYIRGVAPAELPEAARAQLGDAVVYAIHDVNGARLALVADRELAFAMARQHEMTPVSAH